MISKVHILAYSDSSSEGRLLRYSEDTGALQDDKNFDTKSKLYVSGFCLERFFAYKSPYNISLRWSQLAHIMIRFKFCEDLAKEILCKNLHRRKCKKSPKTFLVAVDKNKERPQDLYIKIGINQKSEL